GFGDESDCLGCGWRVGFEQEVGQSFEIGQRVGRVDQPRQSTALGLAVLLPDARALIHSCTAFASWPCPVASASSRAACATAVKLARRSAWVAACSMACTMKA